MPYWFRESACKRTDTNLAVEDNFLILLRFYAIHIHTGPKASTDDAIAILHNSWKCVRKQIPRVYFYINYLLSISVAYVMNCMDIL